MVLNNCNEWLAFIDVLGPLHGLLHLILTATASSCIDSHFLDDRLKPNSLRKQFAHSHVSRKPTSQNLNPSNLMVD